MPLRAPKSSPGCNSKPPRPEDRQHRTRTKDRKGAPVTATFVIPGWQPALVFLAFALPCIPFFIISGDPIKIATVAAAILTIGIWANATTERKLTMKRVKNGKLRTSTVQYVSFIPIVRGQIDLSIYEHLTISEGVHIGEHYKRNGSAAAFITGILEAVIGMMIWLVNAIIFTICTTLIGTVLGLFLFSGGRRSNALTDSEDKGFFKLGNLQCKYTVELLGRNLPGIILYQGTSRILARRVAEQAGKITGLTISGDYADSVYSYARS